MAMMASAASDPFDSFHDDNDLLETDPLDGGKPRILHGNFYQF